VEEHETLFSSLGRPEGVAVLAEGMSGEVLEHAYWGGMRDRIPLSQTDPMLGLGAPAAEEEAGRVRVPAARGLCLIRSGQDWTDTDGDERRIVPRGRRAGVAGGHGVPDDEGAAVGCFANRYVTVEGANAATA
jgi:aldoxime dehydratase